MGTEKIHNDGVAQQKRESHQHPGQEGRLEVEQAKEIHPDVGVPPAPDVHQHDGEGLAQEHKAHKGAKYLEARQEPDQLKRRC